MLALGQMFGAKWDGSDSGEGGEEAIMTDPDASQSIEEIANAIPVVPRGGDTWAATLAAIKLMEQG